MPEREDQDEADDHLSDATGIELPEATLAALRSGLPRLLRVKDWPGPALFHSELGSGTLVSSTDPAALIQREGEHAGYIFGSVRQSPDAEPYSVFVLRPSGDVYLLDAGDPARDCFVNVSLAAFLASMLALHGAFDHVLGVSEEREKHVASFRELLVKLDAKSTESDEHYWPGWLEAMH